MFITTPQPLAFWERLQSRLQAAFVAQNEELAGLLRPLSASIDNAEVILNRARVARAESFSALHRLEVQQALILAVEGQRTEAENSVGIPALERRIQCFRAVTAAFERHMTGLPRRTPRDEDIQAALREYIGLKNAGQGEAITADRQRLRAFTTEVLVMGAEDATAYETAIRDLHTRIDQLDAELQALRVDTRLSLRVPPGELVTLLAELSVAAVEEQLPATSAPATGQEG